MNMAKIPLLSTQFISRKANPNILGKESTAARSLPYTKAELSNLQKGAAKTPVMLLPSVQGQEGSSLL